jgi:hypothetical protein
MNSGRESTFFVAPIGDSFDNYSVERNNAGLQKCSPGQVASGFTGRFGKHVNAMGLVCADFVQTAAAARAPAPAHAPPPPPEAAIRRNTAPLSPDAFVGTWLMTTSLNGNFEFHISRDGERYQGRFTNLDGASQYDGTFTGALDGRSLRFDYVQPAVSAKGTGYFAKVGPDGLTGGGRDTASNVSFGWTGKRKPGDDVVVR